MHTPAINAPRVEWTGLARVFAGAVIISFSAVLVKLTSLNATTVSFYRVLFGGGMLLALALIRRENFRVPILLYGLILAIGIVFALDLESWHRSIGYIGPGLATILANFQVFFLALAGVLLFNEVSTWRLWLSIPAALAGLWLLVGVDTGQMTRGDITGILLGLSTAFWYALYLLMLRHSQRVGLKLAPLANMALVSLATALVLAVWTLAAGDPGHLTVPQGRDLWIMLLYGFGPQAIGWMLISTGLPRLPASMVGLIILIQPTLSFTWDILFFHRPTGVMGAFGAALALAAIYLGLSSGRSRK